MYSAFGVEVVSPGQDEMRAYLRISKRPFYVSHARTEFLPYNMNAIYRWLVLKMDCRYPNTDSQVPAMIKEKVADLHCFPIV